MGLNILPLINEVVEMVNDIRSTKKVSPLSLQQNNKRFEIFFLTVRRISLLDKMYEKTVDKIATDRNHEGNAKGQFCNFLLLFYLRILSENYHVSKDVRRLFLLTIYYR